MFNKIRVPTMEITEIAVLVGNSDTLSTNELSKITIISQPENKRRYLIPE